MGLGCIRFFFVLGLGLFLSYGISVPLRFPFRAFSKRQGFESQVFTLNHSLLSNAPL